MHTERIVNSSLMLLLTLLAVMNNLHDGETNAIEGISHFALFAAFVALVMMGLV